MVRRTVVVIGATGYQGGSVASELLQHPDTYQVRALTRNPASPAAQSLAARGADVRRADLNDGPDAPIAAFQNAHAIYALTDFWQTQSGATETAQGKSIMDAAAGATSLEHLVWSAIPDPEKLSNGRFLKINHWKSKSLVTEYIQQEKPELWAKTTTILFPNYLENCLTAPERYLPVPDATGAYTLSFPHSLDTVMPNVAIADTGKLVQTILNAGSEYFTKTIAFYSQALSEAEKLNALGKKYNIPTQYRKISVDEFQRVLESRDGMSAEMAVDFAEQLMIFEEYCNIYARKEFIQAREIPGLSLQTWADFLHAHELPVKRA